MSKLATAGSKKTDNFQARGWHTVTPFIVVRNAEKAIDFYVKVFGAKEQTRMIGPDGKIMHARIQVGDSLICLSEENQSCGGTSPETLGGVASSLYLYVADIDASFKKAVDAGCKAKMPPTEMFWGDMFSSVQDPFGHCWSLATHVEDLTDEQVKKRQQEFFAQMANCAQPK